MGGRQTYLHNRSRRARSPRRHRDLGVHVDAEALAYPLEGTGRFRIDDAEERFARSLPGESQARDRRTDQRRGGELLGPRAR